MALWLRHFLFLSDLKDVTIIVCFPQQRFQRELKVGVSDGLIQSFSLVTGRVPTEEDGCWWRVDLCWIKWDLSTLCVTLDFHPPVI